MTLQWAVFHANLDPVLGHEQAGHRPVLVLSAEPIGTAYDVVMVAPVTSRKANRKARLGEVLLSAGTAGLLHESFVLCYQVRALDKRRLGKRYGEIDDAGVQDQIRRTLADCLDLDAS